MNERLNELRRLMEERHMDAYLIPTSDFHESEYDKKYFFAVFLLYDQTEIYFSTIYYFYNSEDFPVYCIRPARSLT